jgi:hypothetical protein
MVAERAASHASLIDALDRVLDKGIVIDAWVRVSPAGIDLITVDARVVVASIETYLKDSEAVGQVLPAPAAREVPAQPTVGGEPSLISHSGISANVQTEPPVGTLPAA